MTGIGITAPDGTARTAAITSVAVLLDSGSTVASLPSKVLVALASLFEGAQYDQASRLYLVDCAKVNPAGTIDFAFNNKVIRVPFSDLIFQTGDKCYLVVQSADGK